MKFWQALSFTDPEHLIALAKGAEAAGFEGALVSEHVVVPQQIAPKYPYSESGMPDFTGATPFPEPWSAISAMAAVTERLRFSTMVYILPLHHPLEVANAVATAAVLSNNRVVLGAGAGWMREEYDILGIPFETRGRRFNESLEVLRALWKGEMVEHTGEFFEFPLVQLSPAPSAPVPIFIGGVSGPALRRAAACDGWLGSGHTLEQAEQILGELGRLRKEIGRDGEPFEAIVPLVTPPDGDSLRRIEDLGATGTVHYPFSYTVGPDATLQQKLDAMTRFGDEVIAKLG